MKIITALSAAAIGFATLGTAAAQPAFRDSQIVAASDHFTEARHEAETQAVISGAFGERAASGSFDGPATTYGYASRDVLVGDRANSIVPVSDFYRSARHDRQIDRVAKGYDAPVATAAPAVRRIVPGSDYYTGADTSAQIDRTARGL